MTAKTTREVRTEAIDRYLVALSEDVHALKTHVGIAIAEGMRILTARFPRGGRFNALADEIVDLAMAQDHDAVVSALTALRKLA